MNPRREPLARSFVIGGTAAMLIGFFIGGNLSDLGWFGFLVALAGTLALLYGVLAIVYRRRPQ